VTLVSHPFALGISNPIPDEIFQLKINSHKYGGNVRFRLIALTHFIEIPEFFFICAGAIPLVICIF
jgi:hypothetical protein